MKKNRRKFKSRQFREKEMALVIAFYAGAFVAIAGVLLFLNAQ